MKFVKPFKLYGDLLRKNQGDLLRRNQGRFLGLCLHDKHVHLAASDPDNIVAVPLRPTISRRTSINFIADRIQTEISNLRLEGIVVGCSDIRSVEKPNVEKEKILIDKLRQTGKFECLKYTYWDMKLKSKVAERVALSKVNALVNTFPQDMPEAEIENKMQNMATFVLQAFLDYGRVCSGSAYSLDEGKMKNSDCVGFLNP